VLDNYIQSQEDRLAQYTEAEVAEDGGLQAEQALLQQARVLEAAAETTLGIKE